MESPTDAQLFFSNLVTKFGAYEYIPATIDILLNSFHVYILSHRQMRTSSMTTILIGIALADMIFPVIAIKKQLRIWVLGAGLWQARQSRYQEVRLLIHVFFLAIMSATTFAYYVFQAIYSSELGVGDVVLIDNSSSELQGLRALRLWYPLVSGNMSFVNPVMLLMLNRDIQKCLGNVCSGKSIDIHRTSSILAMNRTAT
uniref:G_PROTEIN_RECEP_F1_2 domain-containing protein n=1 Tax=Caenorhabditis tropicalis TaxID=1561998 RepID=A0A1I7UTZ0_9PELO